MPHFTKASILVLLVVIFHFDKMLGHKIRSILSSILILISCFSFSGTNCIEGVDELSSENGKIHSGTKCPSESETRSTSSAILTAKANIFRESFSKENLTVFLYTTKTSGKDGKFDKTPVISTEEFQLGFFFIILIHGFISSCETFEDNIIPEYLKEYENAHLLCLDWSSQANPPEGLAAYDPTVLRLPGIASAATNFISLLDELETTGTDPEIHIVAFSLGAHLAGMIGANVKNIGGKEINRITGLEPAAPSFDNQNSMDWKLDSTDAKFVDIVHTSGGRLGTAQDLGHVDFYMNDGRSQPRCAHAGDSMARITESLTGYCSHRSAIIYFAESIKNTIYGCKCKSFKAFKKGTCKCDSDNKVIFGEHCSTTARGKYFVRA